MSPRVVRTARSVAINAVSASMVACNALSGVGDLTFGASSGPGGGQGGAVSADAAPASSSSSGGGVQEDCLDGVDNDLDGLVDCADADCAAFACAPAVDAQYAIEIDPATPCPPPTQTSDVELCSCACSPSSNADCDVHWTDYSDPACALELNQGISSYGCFASTHPFRKHEVFVSKPGACTAAPPVTTATRLCIARVFGAGCGPGEVCVPKPAPESAACVLFDGASACPPSYTEASVVSDAASSCMCSCEPADACSGGATSYYSAGSCMGSVAAMAPGDGSCYSTSAFASGVCAKPTAKTTCNGRAVAMGGARSTLCCAP